MAVINPEMGGTPDATAMANDNGRATKETEIAATMSFFQCFLNPFSPVYGMLSLMMRGFK